MNKQIPEDLKSMYHEAKTSYSFPCYRGNDVFPLIERIGRLEAENTRMRENHLLREKRIADLETGREEIASLKMGISAEREKRAALRDSLSACQVRVHELETTVKRLSAPWPDHKILAYQSRGDDFDVVDIDALISDRLAVEKENKKDGNDANDMPMFSNLLAQIDAEGNKGMKEDNEKAQ